MKRLLILMVAMVVAVSLAIAGCSQAAPAPAATPAPAAPKAAEPTKAAAPAAQPTAAPAAQKAAWPESGKPMTFIVGSAAGGSSDVGFRVIAAQMEKALGVSIQVVNKPAAGQQEGLTELAKAKPDGYTIGMTNMPQSCTIYLDPERKAPFTRKSFQPIGMQVVDPGVIAVKADSPYKTLKDLIDAAKVKPGTITASTTGVLGDDHLSLLQAERALGIKFATVHFNGAAPSITAMLGGHVEVNFNNVGDYMAQYKAGQIRLLAILDKEQSRFYPGEKTFEEQTGIKLYSSSSRGVSAPAGVPKDTMDVLTTAFKKAWDNPDHQKAMADSALSVRYLSPDEMDKYWAEVEAQLPALMEDARKDPGTKAS